MDSISADLFKFDAIVSNLIKSQPELINIAIQSPTEFLTESTVQPILIAAVGAFTVNGNMSVVKLVNDILVLFESAGESQSGEFNVRQYLHFDAVFRTGLLYRLAEMFSKN